MRAAFTGIGLIYRTLLREALRPISITAARWVAWRAIVTSAMKRVKVCSINDQSEKVDQRVA